MKKTMTDMLVNMFPGLAEKVILAGGSFNMTISHAGKSYVLGTISGNDDGTFTIEMRDDLESFPDEVMQVRSELAELVGNLAN